MFDKLKQLFRGNSLENPRTPLTIEDDRPSSSGYPVSLDTVLGYPAVWRAVNLISKDLAKLPLVVYRKQKNGKTPAVEHPSYTLLRYKPNPYHTAFVFKTLMQTRALLYGNAYAYIYRNADGTPYELLPLSPEDTFPVRENGVLLYVTQIKGNEFEFEQRKLPAMDVLHVRGVGDELRGYSLFDKARESLGLGLAMQRFQAVQFKNAARPSVVLEHPAILSEIAKKTLREQWERMHSGLDNAHRIAVLSEGMKLHAFSYTSKDVELIESRHFEVRQVANWFGIPPSKLADKSSVSYNSLEMENQAYLDEGISPWSVAWEEECWNKLLSEDEKAMDSHVIEMNLNALIRANMEARYRSYKIGQEMGVFSSNDIRNQEGFNAIENGDTYFISNNVKPLEIEEEDTDTIQQQALNGAQVASLLSIVENITSGIVAPKAGKALIAASFPMMTAKQINAIVNPLEIKEEELDTNDGNKNDQPSSGNQGNRPTA